MYLASTVEGFLVAGPVQLPLDTAFLQILGSASQTIPMDNLNDSISTISMTCLLLILEVCARLAATYRCLLVSFMCKKWLPSLGIAAAIGILWSCAMLSLSSTSSGSDLHL